MRKIKRLQELSQEDSNEASKYLIDNLEDLICESLIDDTQPTYTTAE